MPDTPRFETDIKPMFREKDQRAMKFAFDLWNYADVSGNASGILQMVNNGDMPCDGAWSADQVAVFRQWVEGGMRE